MHAQAGFCSTCSERLQSWLQTKHAATQLLPPSCHVARQTQNGIRHHSSVLNNYLRTLELARPSNIAVSLRRGANPKRHTLSHFGVMHLFANITIRTPHQFFFSYRVWGKAVGTQSWHALSHFPFNEVLGQDVFTQNWHTLSRVRAMHATFSSFTFRAKPC